MKNKLYFYGQSNMSIIGAYFENDGKEIVVVGKI